MGRRAPDDPWPYYFVARLLLAEGDTATANQALREFVRRSPDARWTERATELLKSMAPQGPDDNRPGAEGI